MKAGSIFVAFLAVVLFMNSPVEKIEATVETFGLNLKMIFGAIAIGGLFFLLRGSRTPKG